MFLCMLQIDVDTMSGIVFSLNYLNTYCYISEFTDQYVQIPFCCRPIRSEVFTFCH